MKSKKIIYWVLKVLITIFFLNASIMELIKNESSVGVYQYLGFPLYMMSFIAICRILALVVIWIPNYKRLKEWAYSGLVIDVVGATYSIYMVSMEFTAILIPLLVLTIVLGVYFLYHQVSY